MNQGSVPELPDARVFISYAHADQNGRYTGDLRGFAQDIVDTMANVHDRAVQTFIDVEQGTWGEDLWRRLEREESLADFMIPFITPAYLRSDGCRREYLHFMAQRDAAAERSTLLPLIWLEPRGLFEPGSADPIKQDLFQHRGVPVGAAHDADPDSAEYRRVLREVTDRLADVLDAAATNHGQADGADGEHGAHVDDQPALDEMLAEIQQSTPQLVADFEAFVGDFEEFGNAMQTAMMTPEAAAGTPVQAQAYLTRVGKKLEGESAALLGSANAASTSWREYTALVHRAIGATAELDATMLPDGLVEPLRELSEQIPASDIADMQNIAMQMGGMSRSLRPASEALLVAVRTFRDLAEGADLVEVAWNRVKEG